MAMVARETQFFCAACTLQPVACTRAKKVVSFVTYCPHGNISRRTALRSHHRLSSISRKGGRSFFSERNQYLKALSFQGVTKDDDPEGREGPKSPSPVYFSLARQGMEEAEQSSAQSSRRIPSWFCVLQKQGCIQQAKAILRKAQSDLKPLDKDEMIKQLQEGRLSQHILECWRNSEVWIKWPLAIFLPCFLAVTLFCGFRASSDLLPLWIMGPLMMGTFIKSYLIISPLCVRITTNAVAMGKACFELWLFVKNGNLTQVMELHLRQIWSQFVDDIRNGKFKEILRQKLKEFQEWCSDTSQDFVESIWPQWRATVRFLKKIF